MPVSFALTMWLSWRCPSKGILRLADAGLLLSSSQLVMDACSLTGCSQSSSFRGASGYQASSPLNTGQATEEEAGLNRPGALAQGLGNGLCLVLGRRDICLSLLSREFEPQRNSNLPTYTEK